MKKTLLLLSIVAWAIQGSTQVKTVEQLQKELAGHPQKDIARVNLLFDLSYSTEFPVDKREKFVAEALSISREIGYTKGEGIALANQGFYLYRMGKPTEADSLIQLAEALAKESEDPGLTGIVFYRKGIMLYNEGKKEGVDYLVKAERALEKTGELPLILFYCQVSISDYYQIQVSDYPPAMEYLLKAIHTAEKLKSNKLLAESWINLAGLYSLLGDHDNALVYYKKAEGLNQKKGEDEVLLATLKSNIGETYRLMGKYPEAIVNYNEGTKYNRTPQNIVVYESNLADVYTHMDSLDLAFKFAFSALEKHKSLGAGSTNLSSWIDGVLSRAHLKKGNPDSSIFYARRGLDSAIALGTVEYMRDNTASLANAYAYKKDFAKAYNYHQQHISYRDSMLSTEVRNKTIMLQYNNDLDKKQAQILQLNQQKKEQRNFLISALIVLTLIVITAALLLRNNRQKQKANDLLQKQKQEIDDKAHQLAVQKDHLEQSYNNVEQLGEIGRKITSSLSVEKIISTVYDNVNSVMDASVFGIGIYNDELRRIEFPATYENGQALPFYTNSIDDKNRFGPLCFTSGEEIIIGDLNLEYKDHIDEVLTPHEGDQPVSIIFLPLITKGKKSGVITVQSFQKNAYTDYHLYMLRNIAIYTAIALENAESYEELNQTIASLKSTQAQLIQSEKMASLGELTAGIAHEIQNPLNFITNFSEVNTELLTEMNEEIEKGEYAPVKLIAMDVAANQQKINHHGKRADAIVKGMLQHSRTSSVEKELTNLNVLTDEYVRLTFHGLRAKDKSFNARFETNFDPGIGKIMVIRQDIGRVILNLVNNAFFAVDEKKKQVNNGFEPTVFIKTKRTNGRVEITVGDNGNGIPAKVLDKIFQPFFTTKPTGQGTGLGLSLSYDIVKAHGGEIKVITKENEGTEFTISLPS